MVRKIRVGQEYIQFLVDYNLEQQSSTEGSGRREKLIGDASERLRSASKGAVTITGPANFGIVDRNNDAAFMAFGMSLKNEEGTYRTLGVTSFTLVNRVPSTINLHGPASSRAPFEELLRRQKDLVRRFVVANE